MTQRSQFNNTNVALAPFQSFTGRWETTSIFLELSAYVNSSAYLAVSIQQSADASNVTINTTYNYTPTDEVTVFNGAVGLPYYRVVLANEANIQVAHMSLTTILTTIPSLVEVNGGSVVVSGNVGITSPLDANGNVKVNAENLINEVNATRRVDFLVVGDWYRVASVGLTSGAQWNAIGAIVDGESSPAIGRLFKCLAIGPAVAGGGTCYDMPYTTDVSATITNFPSFPATQPVSIAQDLSCNILNFPATQPVSGTVSLTDPTSVRVRDAFGDPITTTAGNLMVGISNIYTANPLHTIVDSGPATQAVTGTFFQATQPVSGTVSLTDPTTVRVRDTYGDPILTTAGNLMVGINNIYTANPLHTIVDSGPATQAVTGTFFQATQPVSIASSVAVTGTFYQATQPVSIASSVAVTLPSTSVSNNLSAINNGVTIKNTPGQLISLFMNSGGIAGTNYVKIYNSSSPTSTDTPVLVIPLDFGRSQNVDCVNLNFTTAIGLRVTANAANNDNNAPTNTINVNAFYI